MKKVLIISYFFPPSNFAGSYRISSWAKYLHLFGYYPVIITRCWNPNQSELTDEVINNTFSHEKHDHYEVYYIPYNRTIRDRIHAGETKLMRKWLSKIFTLNELIFQNYSNALIPYANLYRFADKLLDKNKDFTALIVSGRPFQLFRFGWLLHKKHGIKWFADYRDDWSTSQWIKDLNPIEKCISYLESRSEKKWLSNAAAFISCSNFLVQNISSYIGKNGFNILNGFDPEDYETKEESARNKNSFVIVYNGTLYYTQPIEVFSEALKMIIDTFKNNISIQIEFPGLLVDPIQADRVKKALLGYEAYYKLSPRISKTEVIAMQKNADLLLMCGHQNIVGNFSSKIFEYLACRRTILLCPSDNDVLEQLIKITRTGIVCSTKADTYIALSNLVSEKIKNGEIAYRPNKEEIEKYTRKRQTKYLANVLDQIC